MPKNDPQNTIRFHSFTQNDWDAYAGASLESLIFYSDDWVFIFDMEIKMLTAVATSGNTEYSTPVERLTVAQTLAADFLEGTRTGWTAILLPALSA